MFKLSTKQILQWISYTLGVVIIIYFFISNGGFDIFKQIFNLDFTWGSLAFILFLSSVILGAMQWQLLLKTKKTKASFISLFKNFYLGLFFNSLIFSVAGEFSKAHKLKKVGIPLSQALFFSFLDRYIGFTSLTMLFFLSCLLSFLQVIHAPLLTSFFWISALIFSFSLILLPIFFSNSIQIKFWKTISKYLSWQWIQLKLTLSQKNKQIEAPRFSILLFSVIITSISVQSVRIIAFYCCTKSLGISIHPLYLFCFVPVMSFFFILPFNIGGWGLPQTIGIKLFSLTNVISYPINPNPSLIASAIVLPSLMFYLISLLGGLFLFSKVKLT